MRKRLLLVLIVLFGLAGNRSHSQPVAGSYENSLVLVPHYVAYATSTDQAFATAVSELRQHIGTASHLLLGFAASLPIDFPNTDITQPITRAQMSSTLETAGRIVDRAAANGIVVHISILSGFFHGNNGLRQRAILQDVRNAQWFSDGWIADPSLLHDASIVPATAWITPSRYARPLRSRMEEGARTLGAHLAMLMARNPETLLTISGDGEVELNYERTIAQGERLIRGGDPLYADYSPFMVEEFRDSIRHGHYDGDKTPGTDDNHDGHTFNGDFHQDMTTWRLRYFDASGPIPFSAYLKMPEKLPSGGPYFVAGGFDAPRIPHAGDAFWDSWMQFRTQAVGNYVRDFASWITTSPDAGGFRIPPSRFYSHQIPADFLFGEKNGIRLRTSASRVETAMIAPTGSTGVTAFNTFDGQKHTKTATPSLFAALSASSKNWGVFEYNPSMPTGPAATAVPSSDVGYYMAELRSLYAYRPHVIVPFAWSEAPEHRGFNIRDSAF